MKKYDVIVPLGEFCATAMALKACGVRKASYPFDWSAGVRYEKCGFCGLEGKVRLICNDFKDAFNFDDYEEFWSPQQQCRSVINTCTGLQYLHDFPWNKTVKDFFPEYLEKYERRVERLYHDIKHGKHILFVFATRCNRIIGYDIITKCQQMLMQKFPDKDLNFLYLFSVEECGEKDFYNFDMSENIRIVLYKDINKGEGNSSVLQKIFTAYVNHNITYDFVKEDIINYGLSIKENWGRWSDGEYVYIKLPMPFVRKEIQVEFKIFPYFSEKRKEQNCQLFINDVFFTNWHFEQGKKNHFSFNVSSEINNREFLDLKFIIDNPISQAEQGINNDMRKLGIGFQNIIIEEI